MTYFSPISTNDSNTVLEHEAFMAAYAKASGTGALQLLRPAHHPDRRCPLLGGR